MELSISTVLHKILRRLLVCSPPKIQDFIVFISHLWLANFATLATNARIFLFVHSSLFVGVQHFCCDVDEPQVSRGEALVILRDCLENALGIDVVVDHRPDSKEHDCRMRWS